jgi:hypothetical protein
MRNTLTYPLRDEEVLDYLERQMKAYQDSQLVGGMDGMIIQHLQALVVKNPITTETKTTTAGA